MNDDQPVYIISVAAELSNVHPQTLRLYERKGLVVPKRTIGKSRRYSKRDIEKLKQIQYLTQEIGLNLAGVKQILELQKQLEVAAENLRRAKLEIQHVEQMAKMEIANMLLRNSPQLVKRERTGLVPFNFDWYNKFVKELLKEIDGEE